MTVSCSGLAFKDRDEEFKYVPSTERKQTKCLMTHVHMTMEVHKNASKNCRQVHKEQQHFPIHFKVLKRN